MPCEYRSLWKKNEKSIATYLYNKERYWDTWAIKDLHGNRLSSDYRSIDYITDTTALVKKDNTFSVIKLNGTDAPLKKFSHKDMKYLGRRSNSFVVKDEFDWAIMNADYRLISDFDYEYITEYYDPNNKTVLYNSLPVPTQLV